MLLRSFERCQKWIVNYTKLVIYLIILLNISSFLDENKLYASCNVIESIESNHDVLPVESVISRQDPGTYSSYFTPLILSFMGTLPTKVLSYFILRSLKNQQLQQDQDQFRQPGFGNGNRFNNAGNNGNNGNNNNNGNRDNNDDDDDDDDDFDGDDDNKSGRKKSYTMFVGRGNIQMKNYNENEEEAADDSMEKHYTLQMIDEEKGVANFNKDMNGANGKLSNLMPKNNNNNNQWDKAVNNNKKSNGKSNGKSKSNNSKSSSNKSKKSKRS